MEYTRTDIEVLSPRHIEYVLLCFARGKMPAEVVKDFRFLYPTFGLESKMVDKDINENLRQRFKQLKHKYQDKIAELADNLPEDNLEHIPMARPEFHLRMFEDLYKHYNKKKEDNASNLLKILDLAGRLVYRVTRGERVKTVGETVELDWDALTSQDDVLSLPIPKNVLSDDIEEDDEDVDTAEASTQVADHINFV